jgi:peptide/nickel transport system ATP-binding protein
MTGDGNAAPRRRLLTVSGVSITADDGTSERTLVRRADLHADAGETIGIVGESGSGKSMLVKSIIDLLPPNVAVHAGSIGYGSHPNLFELSARDRRRLRGHDIGLIMQDPFTMLNPVMRCWVQVTDRLRSANGRRPRRSERRAEAVRLLREVGIDDPTVADRYPFQLSGGMRQRVAIAAALAGDPALLLADEPSTALDVTTQREILALLSSLQTAREMALVLITHDLRVAMSVCDRVYVLYAGSVLEVASAQALDAEPRHPYSLGLLLSEPSPELRVARLAGIPGSVPRPDEVAGGCAFAPRCSWAKPQCTAAEPELSPIDGGSRFTACVRAEEIREEMREVAGRVDRAASAASVADTPALVRVERLSKRFSSGDGFVQALDEVSITIRAGESVGLVGESGSGKTTLGRCLVGLEHPDSGEIEIAGIPASDYAALTRGQRSELRETVQVVFQDPYSSLNPVRRIGTTLAQALALRSGDAKPGRDQVMKLLEQVGLPAAYASRKPAALSGGERQRVAIARALALNPRLIICDEPVSALDVSVQAQVLNLFNDLQSELGLSYLFVTHDMAVVRQVVDRLYVLREGEIVESGVVTDVLDSPSHPYTQELVAATPGRHGYHDVPNLA